MAGRMRMRASTEVGPLRVSVAPSTRARSATARAAARRIPAGLSLPRKADLPPPLAPAGWYPDPEDSRRMRWWNGTKWTRRFAEPGAIPVVTRTADAPPKLRPVHKPAARRLVNPRLLEHTRANLASYPRRTRNSRRG